MEKLSSMAAGDGMLLAKRWLVVACLVLLWLGGLPSAEAQQGAGQPATEWQLKAAYLFKFGRYVEWPGQVFANPESPLRIGVIGADELADELLQIVQGRTINRRPVVVEKLDAGDSIVGLNVLFIGRTSDRRLAYILARTKGKPILTVTESEQALALGSTINFVIVNGRVRFEISPKTADLGQLYISARLLAAAHKVAPGAS